MVTSYIKDTDGALPAGNQEAPMPSITVPSALDALIVLASDARSHENLLVTLDESGDVGVEVRTYYGGDGTPVAEWHNRTLVWTVRTDTGTVDGEALHRDLTDGLLRTLLQRVADGHDVRWDGSNQRGYLTPDAVDASEQIDRYLDDAPHASTATVWDAREWLLNLETPKGLVQSLGLIGNEDDARLDEIAENLLVEARDQDVVIGGGARTLRKVLREVHDEVFGDVRRELLEEIGVALYGDRWQTDIARDLDVSDRTVRRWVAGDGAPDVGVVGQLITLAETRRATLDALLVKLRG
jgi:hypothetical protein